MVLKVILDRMVIAVYKKRILPYQRRMPNTEENTCHRMCLNFSEYSETS